MIDRYIGTNIRTVNNNVGTFEQQRWDLVLGTPETPETVTHKFIIYKFIRIKIRKFLLLHVLKWIKCEECSIQSRRISPAA